MTTVAAIDIGSNSVRLLVVGSTGETLCREMNITRLAQGVDADGCLAEEAMARTVTVLQRYGALLKEFAASRLRIAATSAARDAANREVFFSRVQQAVGARPELLSGKEEARLAFDGATRDQPKELGPFLTLDIGGGSTEFAFGIHQPESSLSVDMGCVRVTERFLKSDPVSPDELARAAEFVRAELARVEQAVPCRNAKTWLGMAGTVTSVAALTLGLEHYDPQRTHGFALSRQAAEQAHERLSRASEAQRKALLLEPKRASVILGGTVVLVEIMRYFGVDHVVVSERDILDGLAASMG